MFPSNPPPPTPSWITGVQSFFKDPLTAIKSGINSFTSPSPSAPTAIPQYYQIKPNDTGMDAVANQFGLLLQNVVDANDGAQTLPPVGSFINLQPAPQGGANNPYSSLNGGQVPLNGQAQPFTPAPISNTGQITQTVSPTSTPTTYGYQGEGRGDPALRNLAGQYQAQINGGVMPNTIPAQVQGFLINPNTGAPITNEDMAAAGWTQNPLTGAWQNPTPTAPTGTTPTGGTSTRTVDAQGRPWNAATATTDIYGGKFVQEGATRWTRDANGKVIRQVATQGRWRNVKNKHRGQEVVQENPNATDTASTVLGLTLGSG